MPYSAGAYVSLLAPGKTDYLCRLPPRKNYRINNTRSTVHYANTRETQVNWKKETKKKQEDKGTEKKGKKEKRRKRKKERKDKNKMQERTKIHEKEARKEKRKICHTSRPWCFYKAPALWSETEIISNDVYIHTRIGFRYYLLLDK